MNRGTLLAIGAGFAVLAAAPAQAHHTFAMFDLTKTVTLSGTIKTLEWTNPHIWIQMVVPGPDGTAKEWSIEGGAPNALIRKGWKYGALKAGQKVTLTIHPLKTGQPGGSLLTVTLDDGRSFEDAVSDGKV